MERIGIVIFDMDGVLVDVSGSYRETVRQAATLFYKGSKSWELLPKPLFSLPDLAAVKQSGGLNNDWDLTVRVIELLASRTTFANVENCRDPWLRYRKTIEGCDVTGLVEYLASHRSPLALLQAEQGDLQNPTVRHFYQGDVGAGNIIKQIFQEIYLGSDLFRAIYGRSPRVCDGQGLISRETLLPDRSLLEALSERYILAIATGRPGVEADHALDALNIREYFTLVYTMDDCIEAEKKLKSESGLSVSLSKPNPYMLDAIARRVPDEISRFYYIGDMPDDMIAASEAEAEFMAIGVLQTAEDKENLREKLKQSGADVIVDEVDTLRDVLIRTPV